MEKAAAGIAGALLEWFPHPGRAVLFVGKGNNAGDALVVGRILRRSGWVLETDPTCSFAELGPLPKRKLSELAAVRNPTVAGSGPLLLIDGLLGSGASGKLKAEIKKATIRLNNRRLEEGGITIAVDVPTGLDAETGVVQKNAVQADYTITLGRVKPGLLTDGATNHVGRLALIPLAELEPHLPEVKSPAEILCTPASVPGLLPPRSFDTHKGQMGRIALWAGSHELTGAGRLASAAALRAGGGLVTLFSEEAALPILRAACPPEVMVHGVESAQFEAFDVLGIGPGLGRQHDSQILDLIEHYPKPMVIDADAINALATQPERLGRAAGPRVLTPHPGEMARIDPQNNRARPDWVRDFAEFNRGKVLLLKGARTVVAAAGQPLAYNPTGGPGMASGGMGDVLTGVLTALLGQGLEPFDAARVSAWICGRAAELAMQQGGESAQSVVASDVIAHLGAAFRAWQRLGF